MEKNIDFIKRKFVTADNTIVFDQQFEGYLTILLNKIIDNSNNIAPKMESWITQLQPIIAEYKDGSDEPLDGDDVDRLCKIIKVIINLNQGNITQEESDKELG